MALNHSWKPHLILPMPCQSRAKVSKMSINTTQRYENYDFIYIKSLLFARNR